MDQEIKAILECMEGYVPKTMQAGPDTPGKVLQPETPFDQETGDLAGIDGIIPDEILPEEDEDMMEAVMNANGIKANNRQQEEQKSNSVNAIDLISRLM